jgi:hypothetical protein
MNLNEIKQAVNNGINVYWKNKGYRVIKDKCNQILIVYYPNNHAIGLTWTDGITLNGKEEDFFIDNEKQEKSIFYSPLID